MMMVVWLVVLVWVVLYGLPDLLFHHLQWGALSGARDSHRVAMTFDDGPAPITAEILDRLRQLEVRATFFVVAEAARQHPAIIRRIVAEGHQLGLHGLIHRSAYALSPWRTWREMHRGVAALAEVAGVRPTVYRPPWGHHNLFTWLAARHLGLRRVLWTVAPDDWRPGQTGESIARYVVQLALPGGVIVLHDGGGNRMPTCASLVPMVTGLRALGMELVTVDELPPDPSELRRYWTWWETRFTRSWDIDSIPARGGGEPVLRLGWIRYRGPRVQLVSGRWLEPGMEFGEIHFGNPALSQMSRNVFGGIKAFHAVLHSLGDVARYLERSPKYHDVAAIGGITLLDASRAIEKAGFVRIPVSGWQKWSMWIYLSVLMSIYHQEGWRTLRRFFRLHPVMLAMDRETLARYRKPD